MAKDIAAEAFTSTINNLASRVEALLLHQQNSHERGLIALAGVPGSGKSTVSAALLLELASRGVGGVEIVPMDGFHYTKAKLSSLPDPEIAFKRRGAPFTFDAEAFVDFVKSVKEMEITGVEEQETVLYAPSFDHKVQDPVQGAIPISSAMRVVIVEGNYTLLDLEPWSGLGDIWGQRWFVDAPPEVVKQRLVARHLAAGIETDVLKATLRVEENDLVNGELIRGAMLKPDVVVVN